LLRVSRTTSDGPHWHTRLGLTEIGLSSAVRAVLESVWPEDPAQPSLFAP
jgi:hypothetical protein